MIVYSVMHTGTHFAMRLLEHLGITPIQFHSVESSLTKIHHHEGQKAIVPFRHPYKVFVSHFQRDDSLRPYGWQAVMDKVLHQYRFLEQTIDRFDWVPLQMDCPEKDQLAQLTRVANHFGKDGRDVLDFGWPVVGWFEYRHELPDVEWKQLEPVLKWTGYPHLDMKDYIRPEGLQEFQVDVPRGLIDLIAPRLIIRGTAVVRGPDGKPKGEVTIDGAHA